MIILTISKYSALYLPQPLDVVPRAVGSESCLRMSSHAAGLTKSKGSRLMVNKAIIPILVAIPIILIGAYYILPPFGPNQPTEEQSPINDLSDLLGLLVANEVPLEMREGGVVVRDMEQPFFSVDAQVIKIYDEDVQVFEYPTLGAAENDLSLVTPDGQFQTVQVVWVGTVHFYHADRLIVVYVGENDDIISTFEDLFGPQFAGG